jgi:flagellin-specific chaperone FliS
VKPLYKGDRYDMQNYRPISIIPAFAKLLEKLMYNRIISFLYENKNFIEAQNDFRKEKCIERAVQSFIERIQEALDKQVHTIGIFIDLTKAYDVLNHKLLLEKLSFYGIRCTTNSWFKSYLTNRRQFIDINQSDSTNVMVNRYRSSFMEIKQGMPQGSVLGPLLFLLYINDLPLNIYGGNLVMFADDTNVLIMDSNVGALQNKIDRVIAELEN